MSIFKVKNSDSEGKISYQESAFILFAFLNQLIVRTHHKKIFIEEVKTGFFLKNPVFTSSQKENPVVRTAYDKLFHKFTRFTSK